MRAPNVKNIIKNDTKHSYEEEFCIGRIERDKSDRLTKKIKLLNIILIQEWINNNKTNLYYNVELHSSLLILNNIALNNQDRRILTICSLLANNLTELDYRDLVFRTIFLSQAFPNNKMIKKMVNILIKSFYKDHMDNTLYTYQGMTIRETLNFLNWFD